MNSRNLLSQPNMNFKYLLLSLLSACSIIYVSSIPDQSLWGGSVLLTEHIISNLMHIPAYGLLTFLWLKAFVRTKNGSQFLTVNAIILTGLVLFALSDEIHQSFVPGRSASCMDVGLDILGIFFGLNIFRIIRAYKIL